MSNVPTCKQEAQT